MKKYLKHIPNILTVIRFLLIPIIVTMLSQGKYVDAIIVFSISGLTDILDGAIARKFDLITNFGKLIDPLADKFTQISMLIMLTVKGIIPLWIVIVVFIKEFCMICGASFLYGKELVVSSKWYGKAATTLFYIAIVVSLILKELEPSILANQPTGNSAPPLVLYAAYPLYYIAIIMTLFSLAMYVKSFFFKGYLKTNRNL